MLERVFGSTGVKLPVIGQGTWQIDDFGNAERALRLGVELGLTHIDTAELYRGSEEAIHRAVGDRRRELFLVSKVLPHHASYRGTLEACQKSLARLGTDHLDVYLLHWWSNSHSIDETMRAMGDLADRGLIRHVGVSNLSIEELETAQAALGKKRRIVCDQVLYHLGARGIENDLIPYAQKHDIAIVGYSPFGSGQFPSSRSPGGMVLEELAAQHGVSTYQVALNVLARPEGVFLIPKAEEAAHVRENAAALDFELEPKELERLDEAFPRPPPGPLQII